MEAFEMDAATATAIGTATGAGATAITAVWKLLTSKLNECEGKHEAATAELLVVSKRVASVEGQLRGWDAARKKQEQDRASSETDTA